MEEKAVYINFDELLKERAPDLKLPFFAKKMLKKISHVDDINWLFASLKGKKNVEFTHGFMDVMNVSVTVVGKEHLTPDDKPSIFASNHPLGAADAITIAHVLGEVYGEKIKFYANEFLTILAPIQEMFLPIYKYSAQNRDNVSMLNDFYHSDNHLITFPAGATSRKRKEGILDLPWQKNFIQKAVQYQRNVTPVYFKAQNSRFFYGLQHIREFLKLKVNIEMLFLSSELFKQQGNHFTMYIGEPIAWQTFDKSKTPAQWAEFVREKAYRLPNETR